MKEGPILMSGPMVNATRIGLKTMTRRVVMPTSKRQAKWLTPETLDAVRRFAPSIDDWWTMAVGEPGRIMHCGAEMDGGHIGSIRCKYGKPGDRLWVRETFYVDVPDDLPEALDCTYYRADGECCQQIPECQCADVGKPKWRPSIFMPRWASRITLEITNVRVERLQDITETDAIAEGMDEFFAANDWNARDEFELLWNKLNAKRGFGWDVNPWVWVIEFKRIDYV